MSKKISLALSLLVLLMLSSYILLNFNQILEGVGITGKATSTRLVVINVEEAICNTTFQPGWNLVSFPCLSDDMIITELTDNLSDSYESMRYYTPGDINDPWKGYNPSLPNWTIQDLNYISKSSGYWLYLENATPFYLNNSLSTPTLMDLPAGWNLLGYPSRTARTVNETFYQLIPNYTYVYMYNASDTLDPWKMYAWNTSLPSDQDLNYTEMYYGYFIYLTEPKTFVID